MKKRLRVNRRTARVLPLAAALIVCNVSMLRAEIPQPNVKFVFPPGCQRGQTVEATVSGTDLTEASAVRITGAGVTASVVKVENATTAKISVTITADAAPGERDLRLITPGGISNRFRFFVGQLPELLETEPNNTVTQAPKLETLPVLVNGQIMPADEDLFRFTAKAGETLVFTVDAKSIYPYIADAVPGWFESCLTLYDANGRDLAYIDDVHFQPDPVLVYTFAADGEYVVAVRDLVYRGRADFIYRMSIGAVPHLTHIFPLGAPRDTEARIALFGANLPTDQMTLPVTADSPLIQHIQVNHNGVTSNALPFAVGDLPETLEFEPNDSVQQTNTVTFPITINGRIQQRGDADHFSFTATKGQLLAIEVMARRLNSPVDSLITLFNAQGQQLIEQDDIDLGDAMLTHHADSRLQYTIPADGNYVLRIIDIQGNGGAQFTYRLTITPPRPGFALRITPDSPPLGPGDTVMITARADREAGFDNEIMLDVQDLPPGCVTSDARIPAGQVEARFTITASPDAKVGLLYPRVVGSAVDARAQAAYEAAAQAAQQAEAAFAAAQTATGTAATNLTEAETAATARRQQAIDARKAVDDQTRNQLQTAEANVATTNAAVTGATDAKTTADKALAETQAAATQAQQAHQAAVQAAAEATAAANSISENSTKSEEEKQQTVVEAAARQKAAVDAQAALTLAQQMQQEAEQQAKAAVQTLAQAVAQQQTAQQTLTQAQNQVAAAKTALQAAEEAAAQADNGVVTAKSVTDAARAAQAAAETVAAEKRNAAIAAKSQADKALTREAVPAEEATQAFFTKHYVPTQELLLAIVEPPSFAVATSVPPTQPQEVVQGTNLDVVFKAVRKEGVQGPIRLIVDRPAGGFSVRSVVIPADQNEVTLPIMVSKQAPAGVTQNILINATMNVGSVTVTHAVPAIPIKVVAPPAAQ